MVINDTILNVEKEKMCSTSLVLALLDAAPR